MLVKKDCLAPLWDIPPVDCVQIPLLLVVTRVPPATLLVLLDIQLSLLAYAWFVGIRADNYVLAVDHFGPRVRSTASKTLVAAAILRVPADPSSGVPISAQVLLGNTWIGLGACRMELLSTSLLHLDDVPDVGQIVLTLNQCIEHINEDAALSDCRSQTSLPVKRIVSLKTFLEGWVDVVLEDPFQINGIFL
jgi:hypothetical protein